MAQYNYSPKYGIENYSYVFPFEDTFNPVESTKWMQTNWAHSISFSILYVLSIYAGQRVSHLRDNTSINACLVYGISQAFSFKWSTFLLESIFGCILIYGSSSNDAWDLLVCQLKLIQILHLYSVICSGSDWLLDGKVCNVQSFREFSFTYFIHNINFRNSLTLHLLFYANAHWSSFTGIIT